MPVRQRKNEKAHSIKQRSKINRTKAENVSKKSTRKANKMLQSMPTTYSRERSNSYRDLRSSSVPRKRERARNYKYYNFSIVKPGQLGALHYQTEPYHSIQGWPNPQPVNLEDLPVISMKKENLYQEAQRTAPIIRHRHHRCTWKNDKFYVKNAQRHEIEARKVVRDLNSKGKHWDYSGLDAQCLDDYLKESWGVWDDDVRPDDALTAWDLDTEAAVCCRCDDCVWARYGWVPSEDEQDWYEGVDMKTPESSEAEMDEWAGWFETLFGQGSRLVDAAVAKRNQLVQKGVTELGWVDVLADAEEPWDADWDPVCDVAGWVGLWDTDWTIRANFKAESESSFEIV